MSQGVTHDIFCALQPPLNLKQAQIEASRCYYCYDAPCIQACPTQIDIPSFIRKISNGNLKGAALDILSANIMGGTCARVCPVETLCQKACVREKPEQKPVEIGRLQQFATDEFRKTGEQPFQRGKPNGLKVAVVGAGPAGLSCAHRLAMLGYEVTVFEAKNKAGGLNEYGLAPYKMTDGFAQREVQFILGVGGIELQHGRALGRDFTLAELKAKYAAVFLGIGLGGVNALGVPGEDLPGVYDAAKVIELIRQAQDLASVPVGRNVVVIGGGNTAVDIAIQMKRLGAENVTMVYRRGVEQMGATRHEQELAQKNGVLIKTWVKPARLVGDSTGVSAAEFEFTELGADGKLRGTGRFVSFHADQVFKAIGQTLVCESFSGKTGKIEVTEEFETTIPGVYAGGDCVAAGEDLTVTSVQQGKLAALSIHKKLGEKKAHG
ncbi:NAD(P)-dependent oxidoreductase [Bdellovibrionota bacterium FG-1]